MGDFVKGRPETLVDLYPSAVITGIRQHRAIDVFTDAHPTFREARALLSPQRTRLAGIIVDVFYDFFLSRSWPGGQGARHQFITDAHTILLKNPQWQPRNFARILPQMIREEWLNSYSSLEGMALTFRRVSTRASAAVHVLGAEEDFIRHRDAFESLYREFFPQLLSYSNSWQAANK